MAKIKGTVSFIEVQGRETLYNVSLPDGNIIRSIQNNHTSFKIGENVEWSVDTGHLLVFDKEGLHI